MRIKKAKRVTRKAEGGEEQGALLYTIHIVFVETVLEVLIQLYCIQLAALALARLPYKIETEYISYNDLVKH